MAKSINLFFRHYLLYNNAGACDVSKVCFYNIDAVFQVSYVELLLGR